MTARQLSTALLCLGAVAIGATQYLGTPWPGVACAALALVPQAWEAMLTQARALGAEERVSERRRVDALVASANDMQARLQEQGEQLNSLRNTVNLRNTFGG